MLIQKILFSPEPVEHLSCFYYLMFVCNSEDKFFRGSFVVFQLRGPLLGEPDCAVGADQAQVQVLPEQTAHLSVPVRTSPGYPVQQLSPGQHR